MKLQLSQVHAAFAQAGTSAAARVGGSGGRTRGPDQGTTATELVPVQRPADTAIERVDDLARETNKRLESSGHRVQIGRNEATGHFVVTVLDSRNEVLRQFPSEDFLALSEQLSELRGLFFEAQG